MSKVRGDFLASLFAPVEGDTPTETVLGRLFTPLAEDAPGPQALPNIFKKNAAETLGTAFAVPPRERKSSKTISDSSMAMATEDVRKCMASGDWSKAGCRHFLALYVVMHEEVYKVTPVELTPHERVKAVMGISRMLKTWFDDDAGEMASFMRWTWEQEREREAWRLKNGRQGGRIRWQKQFGPDFVSDYRAHLVRSRSVSTG